MAEAARIGLDNPAFRGRLRVLRDRSEPQTFKRTTIQQELARLFSDDQSPQTDSAVQPSVAPTPARPVTQVMNAAAIKYPHPKVAAKPEAKSKAKLSHRDRSRIVAAEPAVAAASPADAVQLPATTPDSVEQPLTSPQVELPAQPAAGRSSARPSWRQQISAWQLAMLGVACLTLLVGIAISIQTNRVNSAAQAELTALVRNFNH